MQPQQEKDLPATVKICIACRADVSAAKRVKDTNGNYYCPACYDRAITPAARAPSTPKPTPNVAAGPFKACFSCGRKLREQDIHYSANGDVCCAACVGAVSAPVVVTACDNCGAVTQEFVAQGNRNLCPQCASEANRPKPPAAFRPKPQYKKTSSSSSSGWTYGGGGGVLLVILLIGLRGYRLHLQHQHNEEVFKEQTAKIMEEDRQRRAAMNKPFDDMRREMDERNRQYQAELERRRQNRQ